MIQKVAFGLVKNSGSAFPACAPVRAGSWMPLLAGGTAGRHSHLWQ